MITDKRYPKCSELGVLRKTKRGGLCVSTGALHRELGWKKYSQFLPYMKHGGTTGSPGYVTPESCEAWLQSNGKP